MKRWNYKAKGNVENTKVDEFLDAVIELYQSHGYSIAHEDRHGGFVVEKCTDANIAWLRDAADNTEA